MAAAEEQGGVGCVSGREVREGAGASQVRPGGPGQRAWIFLKYKGSQLRVEKRRVTSSDLSFQKISLAHREQICGCQGGGGGGGMDWEFGISRCKLLHKGWINNKVLL